jgi:hypothetical protein
LNPLATCASNNATGEQYCVCPPGYVHDFLSYHDKNCYLPENFMLYYLIASSFFMWGAILVMFLRLRTLRAAVFRLGYLYILILLFQWLWLLCIYLENGAYEAAAFFTFAWSTALLISSGEVVLFLTVPIYFVTGKSPGAWKKRVYAIMGCFIMLQFIATIIVMVYSRSSPEVYNYAYNAYLFALIFVIMGTDILLIMMGIPQLRTLITSLNSANAENRINQNDTRYDKLIVQLDALVVASVAVLLVTVPLFVIAIICSMVLGSVPYDCIFFVLISSSMWSVMPIYLRFYGEQQKDKAVDVISVNMSPDVNNEKSRI